MEIFIKIRSLLITSFANKCLNIGMGLVPMLLIERQYSASASGSVMGLIKVASVIGPVMGGFFSDKLGLKPSLLLSFLISALALFVLPHSNTVWMFCLAGMLAQAGQQSFGGAARLLMVNLVEPKERQESIAWLRMTNNCAQIVSYSVGWLLSKLGITLMMMLDGGTSLLAACIGVVLLPSSRKPDSSAAGSKKRASNESDIEKSALSVREQWIRLGLVILVISGYDFLYELVAVGISAKLKLTYGDQGLAIFSQAMVINTVLCTVLAIAATRFLKSANGAMAWGIIFNAIGALFCLTGDMSRPLVFFGMLVWTLGEVAFMSVCHFVLLQVTPTSKNQGSIYGSMISIKMFGRIFGGAAAFPMVVYGAQPVLFVALSGLVGFGLWFVARHAIAGVDGRT